MDTKCFFAGIIILWVTTDLVKGYQVFVNFTTTHRTTITFGPDLFNRFFDCMCGGSHNKCKAQYDGRMAVTTVTNSDHSDYSDWFFQSNNDHTCPHFSCMLITSSKSLECTRESYPSCYSSTHYQNINYMGRSCGSGKCLSFYWGSTGILDYSQFTVAIKPCQDSCGCLTTISSTASTTAKETKGQIATITNVPTATTHTTSVAQKTTKRSVFDQSTMQPISAIETNSTGVNNGTSSEEKSDDNTTSVIIGVVVTVAVILVVIVVVVLVMIKQKRTKTLIHKHAFESPEYVNTSLYSPTPKDIEIKTIFSDFSENNHTEYVNCSLYENITSNNAIYEDFSDAPTTQTGGGNQTAFVYSKGLYLDKEDTTLNDSSVATRNNQTKSESRNQSEAFHYDCAKNIVHGSEAELGSVYEVGRSVNDLRKLAKECLENKKVDLNYELAKCPDQESVTQQEETYSMAHPIEDIYATANVEDDLCDVYDSVFELEENPMGNPDPIFYASSKITPELGIYFEVMPDEEYI